METTTKLHRCRATRIRPPWPSCRAPIVGTKPIVCPAVRAAATALRVSEMVCVMAIDTVGSPSPRGRPPRRLREDHFQIRPPFHPGQAEFIGGGQYEGLRG